MKPKIFSLGLFFFGSLFGLLLISGCQELTPNYYNLPAYSSNGHLQAVIEIPAGTNKKFEFNPRTGRFEIDQRNGKDRVIQFLGYPGNYGFIPSTYSDPQKGGDGDALDIIVLSESVITGTIMEVIPIGMLHLIDDGEKDDKIVAIPVDSAMRTMNALSLNDFQKKYPKALEMVETWFKSYDNHDSVVSQGWAHQTEALRLIDSLKTK